MTEHRDERAAEVVDAVEDHAEPDALCFQQDDRAHPADEEGIPRLKQDSGGRHARKQVHQMNGGEHGGGNADLIGDVFRSSGYQYAHGCAENGGHQKSKEFFHCCVSLLKIEISHKNAEFSIHQFEGFVKFYEMNIL